MFIVLTGTESNQRIYFNPRLAQFNSGNWACTLVGNQQRSGITKKSIFFLFCQNIPLGKLIQEKIIQSSNELFNGRKFEKFEKCIKWRF